MLEKIASQYDISIADLLADEKIIFSSKQKGETLNNGLIIYQLSEKLIEQLDIRMKEKDEMIKELKAEIIQLKKSK